MRLDERIANHRHGSKPAQLGNDVDDPGVAQIGVVLFEGEAKDHDPGALHHGTAGREEADAFLGDPDPHTVIDAPRGADQLGMQAQGFGLVDEVERIDANAVAADQTWPKRGEIPFAAGGGQDVESVDTDSLADRRELVHERDIDIALGILDRLGRLSDLDRGCQVDTGSDDRAIDLRHHRCRWRIAAGNDLDDFGDGVLAIPRINPFGAVPKSKVATRTTPAAVLDHRDADLFGGTRIDRALIDDHRPGGEMRADHRAGLHQGGEVWLMRGIHGGLHGDDEEPTTTQRRGLGGEGDHPVGKRRSDLCIAVFADRISPCAQRLDLLVVQIQADDLEAFGQAQSQG